MKRPFLISIFIFLLLSGSDKLSAQTEPFTKRVIATGLNAAWEVVYGPNDSLWITENASYKVSRISLGTTPTKTQLIDLSGLTNFIGAGDAQPQGGLMGLAIHPALYSTDPAVRAAKPWVYLAFVYNRTTTSCPNGGPACYFTTRIVRYDYNGNTLINPTIILNNIPGSSDHNSGRLIIGPAIENGADAAHTQYRLYYTVGDMGAGQLTNSTRPNNAQAVDVMEGKVLRINTESDGDAGADAWVPNDNPFYNSTSITPRDYVYTLGHRNAQGLVWGNVNSTWRLYSTEQMDRADDEINIIEPGKNYGWDKVSGYCDDDVNGFKIGGTDIIDESVNCNNITNNTPPIFTMFHTNTTWSTYPTGGSNSVWPAAALSSMAFYSKNKIPGWNNSILVTALKENKVYRLKLDAAGTAITGDTISYFRGQGNRVRKITTDPTGLKFYVARDNSSDVAANRGIVEYTYTGVTLPLELLSFNGVLQKNAAFLKWTTDNESNTASFVIERSQDGVHFNNIGIVAANSNTNNKVDYSYSDEEAAIQSAQILYYRLKIIDKDGAFTYSNIITVSLAGIFGKITVTPNPATVQTKVIVSSPADGKAKWKLMDNTGTVILQNTIELKKGNNEVKIDFTKLAAGIYYLNVSNTKMYQSTKIQKL